MAREYELNYREKITLWVWEQMQAHFGERWLRSFGPVWNVKRERARKRKPSLWPRMEPKARVWADQLKDIPEAHVSRAVHALMVPERTELPNLPEFLALCRGESGRMPTRRAEPEPESEEARLERLARGHAALGRLKGILESPSEKGVDLLVRNL